MRDADFTPGIYSILEAINEKLDPGYDFTCGIDYRNRVFETYDFWAHADEECDCGRSEWEDEISAAVDERTKD